MSEQKCRVCEIVETVDWASTPLNFRSFGTQYIHIECTEWFGLILTMEISRLNQFVNELISDSLEAEDRYQSDYNELKNRRQANGC